MANVSFRMDDTLKMQTECILTELGLNMTTAMTMFAKAIVRERRLPLDLSVDPFSSKANMDHLNRVIGEYESGKAKLIEVSMDQLERLAGEDA